MQRIGSILIVDGEPTIAELLVELLADAGYAALTASDAPSAFWIIINYAPALLLLDMQLPGIHGAELIAQLRGAGVVAMPIVLMSTDPCDTQLHVPGACTCLAKPFDLDDVLACVAEYVQPSAAESALLAIEAGWLCHPGRA